MTGDVVLLPVRGAILTAWEAYDEARLRLERLYADPTTAAALRRACCEEMTLAYERWRVLFLENAR